ncbi:hypothetical protein V8F20_009322 [Naviculisporaceae sp. PSN 640]
MDHLPLPRNPNRVLSFEVPWLTLQRYDGGDFQSYTERQCLGPWSTQEWDRLLRISTKKFQAFFQRWQYFGPLLDNIPRDHPDRNHQNGISIQYQKSLQKRQKERKMKRKKEL